MATKISQCRLCAGVSFDLILNLGDQALTGVFPKNGEPDPASEPLELVKCQSCNLVQLAHNFDPEEMYGSNYGYRSGLNSSMVQHLRTKAEKLKSMVPLGPGDVVIDVGSNDGTSLGFYLDTGATLIGVDPTINKFSSFYDSSIRQVPTFFPSQHLTQENVRAKVISSIAMFYDLPDPVEFAKAIRSHLTLDGVWLFEQSYLPLMLQKTSYDTICHEHLEYYSLEVVEEILKRAELKVIDVEISDANGGSFEVIAARIDSPRTPTSRVAGLRESEAALQLSTMEPYRVFSENCRQHRDELVETLSKLKASGKVIWGLGASTKGNVILQYCGLDRESIIAIGEVNSDKFGARTPGSEIPIEDERTMHEAKPDILLVLPWHFRESIIERESEFISRGGQLLFPLPAIELIGKK
jgi:hypothetical protein